MNGYSVVKGHPIHRPKTENGQRAFRGSSPVSSLMGQKLSPIRKKYQIIFRSAKIALSMVYLTATLLHPSSSAISWYVRFPK